jgi:hypothetical protein
METSKKLAIAFCQEQVIFHQYIINLGAGFHGSSPLTTLIDQCPFNHSRAGYFCGAAARQNTRLPSHIEMTQLCHKNESHG